MLRELEQEIDKKYQFKEIEPTSLINTDFSSIIKQISTLGFHNSNDTNLQYSQLAEVEIASILTFLSNPLKLDPAKEFNIPFVVWNHSIGLTSLAMRENSQSYYDVEKEARFIELITGNYEPHQLLTRLTKLCLLPNKDLFETWRVLIEWKTCLKKYDSSY
jgi:hypothetical protein